MNRIVEFGAKDKSGYFTRNHFLSSQKELDKLISKYNNTDCYTSIYSYSDKDISKADLVGNYCIDFDSPLTEDNDYKNLVTEVLMAINYLKCVFDINENNIMIFFSGCKGFHLMIPFNVFYNKPYKHLNLIYRKITEEIINSGNLKMCDLKIYDNRRLFRIPNTINSKTGLYKIPVSLSEVKKLSYNAILELAKAPRNININFDASYKMSTVNKFLELINNFEKVTEKKYNKDKKIPLKKPDEIYMPPCVEYLMNNGAAVGTRNNSLAFLCSYFMQNGFSIEETSEVLNMWNDAFNDDKIKKDEFEATIKSIYSRKHLFGCATAKEVSVCNKSCKYLNSERSKNEKTYNNRN